MEAEVSEVCVVEREEAREVARIRIRLTAQDLAQTRFAFSPLMELVESYRVLADPTRHELHMPWVARARESLRGLDLRPLGALVRRGGQYTPDFLAPPPEEPFPEFEAEVEALRNSPPQTVREEVARLEAHLPWQVQALRTYAREPAAALQRLANLLVRYHELVLAPYWPRLHTLVEGDVLRRAHKLAFEGPEALFSDLHPTVRYRDGAVEIDRRQRWKIDPPGGRGMLLVPTVFAWPGLYLIADRPWRPTLVYGPRGVQRLWTHERSDSSKEMEAALGSARASILKNLVVPYTTTELSRTLGTSPGTVSGHLSRLCKARLAEPHRKGRRVYYRLTAGGESLLRVFDQLK